jgi:dUTP pyrophosphatase
LIEVSFVKLDPEVETPVLAHKGDAGYDLTSRAELTLEPGERSLVPTGIAVAIPEGYAGFIQPRSGLAARHGISIVNTPGLIDSHYRGEIKVIMVNLDPLQPFEVKRGDKICQLVFQKVEPADFQEVDRLDETVRGEGGFGSTGR